MDGKVLQYSRGKSVTLLWVDKFPGRKVVKPSANFRVVSKERGTLLKLRHTGFSAPYHYAACSAGWAYFLTNLKSVLEHGFDLRSSFDA